jgi:lipopolysaccharide assembly outer membrane protein LptD (OstA)
LVCGLVATSSTVPVLAAPGASGDDDKFTLTADRVEYNTQTRIGRADGHARVTGRGVVITADHLEANIKTQEVMATGNVTLTRGDNKATGSFLRYNVRTHEGRIEQMTGESPPWHVTADAVDVSPQKEVAYEASITPCDPAHPVYLVTARKIEIVPNDHFTAYDARCGWRASRWSPCRCTPARSVGRAVPASASTSRTECT